jgi:hypothetical protein
MPPAPAATRTSAACLLNGGACSTNQGCLAALHSSASEAQKFDRKMETVYMFATLGEATKNMKKIKGDSDVRGVILHEHRTGKVVQ